MEERTFYVESDKQHALMCGFVLKQRAPYQLIIGPIQEQRSPTANARLWLLHTAASEHTGHSKEEMHEFALCRHFGYTEKEVKDLFTGEISSKRIPNKRSSTRNKAEFAAFMEATEIWYGSEFGVWLGEDQA